MRRLIGSTLLLLASAGWAMAALGPLEAAAILTEAKAANGKCAFLNAAEADKMSLFAARAEVAAVAAGSAEAAGPELQKAQARGRATACDAAAKARVREIYSAADEAMEAVTGQQPPAAGPVSILPRQKTAAAPVAPKPRQVQPAPRQLVQPQPVPRAVQPTPVYNFNAQQPQSVPQPQPQYAYAQPAPEPEPQPQPQYVYAQPEPQPQPQPQYAYAQPEPQPQYVYAQPQPEPQPQYEYAQPQYGYAQPQYAWPEPQPILSRRFLARFSVVLDQPPAQPVYAPQAVYQPEPVYAPASDVSGGLDAYIQRASAYYVEIRCQHLSQSDAQLFWQSIASQHASLLQHEAPHAVEAALGEAQTRAASIACSQESAQFVQDSFHQQ